MHKVLEEVPIEIKNQYVLLNRLAEGYKSLSKALMEYIDNSFDSADDFFDGSEYRRNVKIAVTIDRAKSRIIIEDNCEGMNKAELLGLANNINDSPKKRKQQKREWVNGQFGLGAHAFRIFANNLTVISKRRTEPQVSIYMGREAPNAQMIFMHDLEFDPSGTRVELGDIEKREMKNLTAEDLKKEVEVYFEMLLRRNVTVEIVDNEKTLVCEPFDYDSLPGIAIKEKIASWQIGTVRTTLSDPESAIEINLKVCTEPIRRPAYFSRKGRRINYISHLDSFISKTKHRKSVWDNFLLTGYIEVKDNLEPVVTRDDFAGGRGLGAKRSGIYNEIVKIEDKIHEAIESVLSEKSAENFSNLSDHLTRLLSKLAKEDLMNLKYEAEGQENIKGNKEPVILDENSEDIFEIPGNYGEDPTPIDEPGSSIDVNAIPAENSEIEGRKIEPRKRGIRIDFSTLDSDERTRYSDGTIYIFLNHPDFKARVAHTKEGDLGQMKISPRLASYLAAVISSQYKEQFYQQKRLEPERSKVLQEQIDFIFRFEELMKDYINQSLDSIGVIS